MTKASRKERIIAIDALRGFALLGILLMNIQSFANVDAGYFNPTVVGNTEGLNKIIWIIVHTIADQKFMTIFSILFGAGIVLFSENLERKGINPTPVFYKRTAWLVVFGLIHAYILWQGDILVSYGLSAFIVYWLRKWSVKNLLIASLIMLSFMSFSLFAIGLSIDSMTASEVQSMELDWQPSQATIDKEISDFRGGWLKQMPHRSSSSFELQMGIIIIFWRVGGLMILGMALFKMGILTAKRSNGFYLTMVTIGLGLGFAMVLNGVYIAFLNNWDMQYTEFLNHGWNYWGSVLVALGYIGLIMLLIKNQNLTVITKTLAMVGKTAFSNYILQTLIGTFIFYGSGLGYFAKIDIVGQMIIVLFVWFFQLIVSHLWLKYFNYGLLEWIWRGLTYGKFPTLRTNTEY